MVSAYHYVNDGLATDQSKLVEQPHALCMRKINKYKELNVIYMYTLFIPN